MASKPPLPENRALEPMISIGRISGSQGRRGEVAAEIKTDFPERFGAGARFFVAPPRAQNGAAQNAREYVVEDAWFHKGKAILKFVGVDGISEATLLKGHELLIARSQRRELPAGAVYLDDLIGCTVVEGERQIGTVRDWEDTGGGILLHVSCTAGRDAGEVLIPFAEEICTQVNVPARVIQVRLPEGLLELNSTESTRTPRK